MCKRKTGNAEPSHAGVTESNGQGQILLRRAFYVSPHLFNISQDRVDMDQGNLPGLVQVDPVRASVKKLRSKLFLKFFQHRTHSRLGNMKDPGSFGQ